MGGCQIRRIRFSAVVALIILLAACSPSHVIPEYIEQFAADGESIKRLDRFESQSITAVYIIRSDGEEKKSIIQEAGAEGFKDIIRVLTLIDAQTGLIEKVEVLEHHETEDYGGYVTEEWFLDRFTGKNAKNGLKLVKRAAKRQEDIAAITGATYTSQAVIDAVNLCLENYRKISEEVK